MISVVGCGPGHREGMTVEALRAVRTAEVLVGAARLLELFPRHRGIRFAASRPDDAIGFLRIHADRNCALLVTGDPGLASIARKVKEEFGPGVRSVPGVSSAVAACAVAGWDWEGAKFVSMHSEASASRGLGGDRASGAYVVLGGGKAAGTELAAGLKAAGGEWTVLAVRDIGGPDQELSEIGIEGLEERCPTGRVVFLARGSRKGGFGV